MEGMPAHRLALLVTAALLAALLTLGLGLQRRWWRGARWPHHALFFLVVTGVAFAVLIGGWAGTALLPALILLLLMPRTRPGQANHWQLALACALAYVLGAWVAW